MSIVTKNKHIYLDNASATSIDPKVLKEMIWTVKLYGNPSSFNDIGRKAARKLDESRRLVAKFMGAHPEEIIFTSSGSESNNLAILGAADLLTPGEIITSPIEHLSVLEPIKLLKNRGWIVKYIRVSEEGIVDIDDFKKKLSPKTSIVSIMYANNEIGSIQPIRRISTIIKTLKRNKKVILHIDACQAAGYLNMNVNSLGADLISFNGSKIYGPRGVGVLYIRQGVLLRPLVIGGGQEKGLRAGTENLPAIAGLAKATELINKSDNIKLTRLRDYFISRIKKSLPDIIINGPLGDERLPGNVNIAIKNGDSERLLIELDKYGIYCSGGSACTAHSVEPSHVLKAMGINKDYINGALRFSIGRDTRKKDINYVMNVLPKIVEELKKRYND